MIYSLAKWLNQHFEETLIVLCLSIMTLLILYQTLSRFTFNISPSWTQELAQFIQVYFVYIGASYAIKKEAHIKISLLKNRLNIKLHKLFDFVGIFFFGLFCIFLIIAGYKLCIDIKNFNQLSSAMRIPMYIPYLALPLGGLLMMLRLIQRASFLKH